MRKLALVRSACLAALVAVASCKDSSGPKVFNVVGSWSGTTSQGVPISFTVTQSGVTGGSISYEVDGTFCDAEATFTVTSQTPAPIQNNSFTANIDVSSFDVAFTVVGHFTSDNAANGTLVVDDDFCNGTVNATWTATR